MERKDIVVLANLDNYVELNSLEEYMRAEVVLFADLSKPFSHDYRHDVLSLDLDNKKWAFGGVVSSIGFHGACRREDSIVGVYDRTQNKHLKDIVNDTMDFSRRNRIEKSRI